MIVDAIITKWSYLGLLVTAIFTLLTPLAASIHLYCLYAVRILCGLGEGVTAPAMFAMLARWSAPQERSRWLLIRAANEGYIGPHKGLL